jgi:hypothetical protein
MCVALGPAKWDEIMFIDHWGSLGALLFWTVAPTVKGEPTRWFVGSQNTLRTEAPFLQVRGLSVESAQAFIPPSTVRFAPVT